jgi:hypothetical protein
MPCVLPVLIRYNGVSVIDRVVGVGKVLWIGRVIVVMPASFAGVGRLVRWSGCQFVNRVGPVGTHTPTSSTGAATSRR